MAESRALAKDAAELVEVDYEPLPAVTDVAEAVKDSAPLVHDEYDDNRAYTWPLQNGEVEQALLRGGGHREGALPPAAADPERDRAAERARAAVLATGEYTMWSATQVPHIARVTLSGTTGIPETKLRVIAPTSAAGSARSSTSTPRRRSASYSRAGSGSDQVDGGALRELRRDHPRPRRPAGDRARGDAEEEDHRRPRAPDGCDGRVHAARLARDPASRRVALRRLLRRAGLRLRVRRRLHEHDPDGCLPRRRPAPRRRTRSSGRWTRSRASSARIPVEIRRLNFITEFPAAIASGLEIDSGNFHASLDKALELVDYDGSRREQAERRERGDPKQLGIGFSTYVEMCGLAPSRILGAIRYGAGGWDAATVRCLPTGTVQVLIGTSPHGQGHVTTFSQIVADHLGVPIENVEVLHGDTTVIPLGMDTYGSRSLAVGGVAL